MSDPPTLAARLFVALQYSLPQHFLSRLVYRLTRSRTPFVKDALIRNFVRGFRPDLQEAVPAEPSGYSSFNEFFTRALRPGVRPVDPNPSTLVSPVDGAISQIGHLDGSRLLQAKGHAYTLEALLGSVTGEVPRNWAQRFVGGSFATLYLAPFNYHRIHMPAAGTLSTAWYIPGRLFSVNTTTAAAVPNLFARNERVICAFDCGPLSFALVLVGALFVGSMETVWHGEITPRSPRSTAGLTVRNGGLPLGLDKGAEMGRFNMGSTVILLLPPHTADWLAGLRPGDPVSMGRPLAQLRSRVMAEKV